MLSTNFRCFGDGMIEQLIGRDYNGVELLKRLRNAYVWVSCGKDKNGFYSISIEKYNYRDLVTEDCLMKILTQEGYFDKLLLIRN